MGLTFRGTKGSALTHNELDNNFREFVYSGSVQGTTMTLFRSRSLDSTIELPMTAPVGKNHNIQVKSGDLPFGNDVEFTGSNNFRYDFDSNHFMNTGSFTNTGDVVITGTSTITGDTTQSGDINLTGNTTQTGNIDLTGNTVQTGSQNILGDVTIDGILTAAEFHTYEVSSSIIYQSGSTQFGDSADDTHTFRGNVTIVNDLTSSNVSAADVKAENLTITDVLVEDSINALNNVTASFFKGDGSALTNITVFPYVGDADFTGSVRIQGDLILDNEAITFSDVSGSSFSGSFQGDGSRLTGLDIFPYTGSLIISGTSVHSFEGGNVGIHTTNPTRDLHIEANGISQSAVVLVKGHQADAYTEYDNDNTLYSVGNKRADDSFSIAFGSDLDTNERFHITSTGKIGIGTSIPQNFVSDKLVVDAGSKNLGGITILGNEASASLLTFAHNTGSGDLRGFISYRHQDDKLRLGVSSSVQMDVTDTLSTFNTNLDVSGSINATGDITAFHSSDERLKDNISPITNANEKIKTIGGYTYDWNDKSEHNGKDVGVIAQEIEKVLPELVVDRDNGYKAVKYDRLVALLIQSNKELIQRVEDLEDALIVAKGLD